MKKTKTLSILTGLFLLTSCTSVSTRKEVKIFNKQNPVNTQSSFYLIYPKNGFKEGMYFKKLKENKTSAEEVTSVFREELSKNLGSLTISEKNVDLEQGLKDAELNGSQYLIKIDINEWKDAFYQACTPSQNGSGHLQDPPTFDTVDLTTYIYEVKTKSLINKQRLKNKGCPIVLLGVIPVGKNSPEGRLRPMITKQWYSNIN